MENLVLVKSEQERHVTLFTLLIDEDENVATMVGGFARLYCSRGSKVRVMLVSCWMVVFARLTVRVVRGGEYCGVWIAVDELDG